MGEERSDLASRARPGAAGGAAAVAARPEISASWRRVRAGGLAPGAEPAVAPLSEVEVESRRTASALAPTDAEHHLLAGARDRRRPPAGPDRQGRRGCCGSAGAPAYAAWPTASDSCRARPGPRRTSGPTPSAPAWSSGEPVHIRGPEHYVESHTRWSCAAAPVLDPWTGETLGAIDISGPAQSVQRSVLALVGVTARLAGAEVRTEHARALERLRSYAAPVVARVGGRALAVDPAGHIAAVTGFTRPSASSCRPTCPRSRRGCRHWVRSPSSRCRAGGSSAWAARPRRRPTSSSISASDRCCGSVRPATSGSTSPAPDTRRSCWP